MSENKFNEGDKVRVVRDTVSAWGWGIVAGTTGTIGTIGWVSHTDRIHVNDLSNGAGNRILKVTDLELITDAQTIEEGDTVKATHTDGTTVQGVVRYADDDNVDITLPGTSEVAYLYENEGWTFEVVSKAVTPPNVGEPWREGLPLGTVMKTDEEGASILLTEEGWIDQYNYTIADPNSLRDRTTIAYLPESAND